jgi:hypothetical protein
VIKSQSNEVTRGPPELLGGDHIGARALYVLNLIWFGFGYMAQGVLDRMEGYTSTLIEIS